MSSLSLFNRVSTSKPQRININGVNIEKDVSEFKDNVAKALEMKENTFDLLYGGQIMKEKEMLSFYGVKSGVTVHAMKRMNPPSQEKPEEMSQTAIQQVVTALQAALINPAYRNIVEKLLSNPETLEHLITTTPGLDRDPIAMAMLQDPELLGMLADPKLVNNVIKAHPSLGQAATFVAAAVSEEAAKDKGTSTSRFVSRGHYSMDQMSDDEDMDTGGGGRQALGAPPITTNQLGAALAALVGSGANAANAAHMMENSSAITTDFFRQAMAAAGTGPSTSTRQQPRPISENELQQLREMGITDESVARRALEASGGDVQAALEIIFGDGL